MAHEIGHNLGLPHVANGGPNLMSPSGNTDQLTADQFSTIFTDNQFFIDGFDLLIEFEPAGTNNNSAISIDNDSQITATSSLPDKGFFRLSVEQPAETLAAQSSLPQSIQDKYTAQLAREDRPWDKVDLPKRLCACGEEH